MQFIGLKESIARIECYSIEENTMSSDSGLFTILSSNVYILKVRGNRNIVYNIFLIQAGDTSGLSQIYDSEFTNNNLEGSVININVGELAIDSSSFISNEGNALGPLIKSYSSTLLIQNTNITGDITADNVYSTKSGLFYMLESVLKITNCTITGGKGKSAGALYSTASKVEIVNSILNASTTNKAALYSSSDSYIIYNIYIY